MKSKTTKRSPMVARRLLYKVAELSTVDELSIEQTLNQWTAQGWKLDGIQFAIRESSKRPSMAFILFTRDDLPATDADEETSLSERGRPPEVAQVRLADMAGVEAKKATAVNAWERLAQLAGGDDR